MNHVGKELTIKGTQTTYIPNPNDLVIFRLFFPLSFYFLKEWNENFNY